MQSKMKLRLDSLLNLLRLQIFIQAKCEISITPLKEWLIPESWYFKFVESKLE